MSNSVHVTIKSLVRDCYDVAEVLSKSEILETLDLGSANLSLFTDGSSKMLAITTASGDAVIVPSAFFAA